MENLLLRTRRGKAKKPRCVSKLGSRDALHMQSFPIRLGRPPEPKSSSLEARRPSHPQSDSLITTYIAFLPSTKFTTHLSKWPGCNFLRRPRYDPSLRLRPKSSGLRAGAYFKKHRTNYDIANRSASLASLVSPKSVFTMATSLSSSTLATPAATPGPASSGTPPPPEPR